MENSPPDKVMRLPEGSWGENGDHTVWANERIKWAWEIEYRAEGTFLRLLHSLPWQDGLAGEGSARTCSAGSCCCLQASDWPFVIHTGGAVDYGIERIAGHSTHFNRLANLAERLGKGGQMTELDRVDVAEIDAHDNIFQEIDLGWWIR